MMRMRFVLLFICTLVILASCEDQHAPVIQKKEPSGTLTVWIHKHLGFLKDYLQTALEQRFADTKFEFVTINRNYFLDSGQSVRIDDLIGRPSEMPDLIIAMDYTLPYFADRQLLADLEPSLPGSQIDTGILAPSLIEAIRMYDNTKRMIALPLNQEVYALFYNKKLFEQMNLLAPRDGMTWDELLTLSETIMGLNERTHFPLDNGIGSQVMMQELAGGYVDPDSKNWLIKNDQWQRILQFTDRLNKMGKGVAVIRNGVSHGASDPLGMDDVFGEAISAMAVGALENNWMFEAGLYTNFYRLLDDYGADDHFAHKYWDFEWDIASVPTFDGQTGPAPSFSFVGVSPDSRNKQEALEAVSFLVSDDFQHELAKHAWAPALKGIEWQSVFASAYPKLKHINWNAFFKNEPAPYRQWNVYESWDVRRYVTSFTRANFNFERNDMSTIEKLEAMVTEAVSRVTTRESLGVDRAE